MYTIIEHFNHTIDSWIKALEQYSFTELCTKPSSSGWSMGQLYTHLVNDTNFYIEQMKLCLSANDNIAGEASAMAKAMFLNNAFPDAIIEGAPSNAAIPQPASKEYLLNILLKVKDDMNSAAGLISAGMFKGKTKHPGLGYFSADEWLQFAEMHFRHHTRQKKRIDDFLTTDRHWC